MLHASEQTTDPADFGRLASQDGLRREIERRGADGAATRDDGGAAGGGIEQERTRRKRECNETAVGQAFERREIERRVGIGQLERERAIAVGIDGIDGASRGVGIVPIAAAVPGDEVRRDRCRRAKVRFSGPLTTSATPVIGSIRSMRKPVSGTNSMA